MTRRRQPKFPEWLTLREQLFVVAYVGPALGRASAAYEMAGYRARGASASANASKLLRKDRVRQAIDQLSAECQARLQAAGDEEMALLADLMRFSVADLFDADGRQIPIWKLPRRVAAAIKEIRPTKNGTVLTFRDTVHPAEVRLKVLGRLKESAVKVEAAVSLEAILAASNTGTDGGGPDA